MRHSRFCFSHASGLRQVGLTGLDKQGSLGRIRQGEGPIEFCPIPHQSHECGQISHLVSGDSLSVKEQYVRADTNGGGGFVGNDVCKISVACQANLSSHNG